MVDLFEGRYKPFSDHELIEKTKTGDAEAFGELYERYVIKIHSYHYHRTGNFHDAEDLTEDTFTRALRGIGKGQFKQRSGNTIGPWLFRIAHNALVNQYLARQRHGTNLSMDNNLDIGDKLSSSNGEPTVISEANERLELLKECMLRLSHRHCEVLQLRFAQELSYPEIGLIMGISTGAAKILQQRALQALKRKMTPENLETLKDR